MEMGGDIKFTKRVRLISGPQMGVTIPKDVVLAHDIRVGDYVEFTMRVLEKALRREAKRVG